MYTSIQNMHFIEVAVTLITDQINMLKSSLDLWQKGTDMYFKVLNCSNITGQIHSMKTMNDRIKQKQTLFLKFLEVLSQFLTEDY